MKRIAFFLIASIVVVHAEAGEIVGSALDLKGETIPNVVLQLLDENGRRIYSYRYADGNYKLQINNNRVPEDSQGMTAIFSASGRETVSVNLHARSSNTFNIVMPERKEATQMVEPQPQRCKPKYYDPCRYYYNGPCRYHCNGW
jgi:hypothetical protein